ncbi:TPA: 50S ribosomal protein L21e [Candidatus Bipolaricaulota bacterium]|nr:50S ribosomal protein L21e [Candidatus Bipolaricaulota bacterium]
MIGLSRLIKEYEVGEKVAIKIDPSVHKRRPHRRYQGKIGTIVEKRGRAYVVEISVGRRKVRKIICGREHIRGVS